LPGVNHAKFFNVFTTEFNGRGGSQFKGEMLKQKDLNMSTT